MGEWTESKYNETRFGGMDKSVEPHTLDRDSGVMADEFNMLSRTQGLRVRRGWVPAPGLELYVSTLPGRPICPVGIIPFIPNIVTVPKGDGEGDEDDGGNDGIIPFPGIDDNGGGGGGGGTPITLTFTAPQAVVAEVPFTIASSADDHYTGSGASLEWAFQPDGQPGISLSKGIRSGWDDNAWSGQATVLTADRSRTAVTATLKKGNGVQATKTMGYSVASMIPTLTSPVPYRQSFQFTVACKLGGAVQTGYAGNGRGVAISWQAFDQNDNPVSCHVRSSQSGWANGVGTYNGYMSSVAPTAVKLRAIVTYAGESQSADADISGVGLLLVPSSLHVFGDGGTMRINAVGLTPSALSIVAQVGGEAVDVNHYLEMDNGTPFSISSGWEENNVWEHGIRAKSGALAATLTLKLMNGQTELASESITIASALTATIDTDESIKPGETISATATISATGHTITRLPANVVELQILGIDDDVFVDNADNELELSASYENAASGTYTVQVVDMRDDTVLVSAGVTVENIYGALAEAINERNLAKGNATSYTGDEGSENLASYAKAAMVDFIKESETDITVNTVVFYSSSNTGIYATLAESGYGTDEEWMRDTYNKIKTALKRRINSDSSLTRTSLRKNVSKSESQHYDYIDGNYVFEDIDNTIARAKQAAISDWPSDFSSYGSVSHSISAYSTVSTITTGPAANRGATVALQQEAIRIRLNSLPTVACTVIVYSGTAKYNSDYAFSKMGGTIADEGKRGVVAIYQQGTAGLVDSPVITGGVAMPMFDGNDWAGFQGGNLPVILDYDFEHK